MSAEAYAAWCRENGCEHGHCPDGCEHPQPCLADGVVVCGRCLIMFGEAVPLVPCGPEVC